MVKYTGKGLLVKRPVVLTKVQMLNLVLGVGVFSPLPTLGRRFGYFYFFLLEGGGGESKALGGGGEYQKYPQYCQEFHDQL